MAKTVRQFRDQIKEVLGPDPEPFSKAGPNAQSVREEDELEEAHRPVKPPIIGKISLGNLKVRSGVQKATANQNMASGKRYNMSIAEAIVKKVLEKNKITSGRTATGQVSDTVDTEPRNIELTGQLK